jgi:branched-chain amino acid transport system permease protein
MNLPRATRDVGMGIALLFLVIIPLLLNSNYATAVFISVLLFFILGAIFDFMLGYLNIFNFGVGGFMALGGYTSALLATYFGISPWLGLLAGGLSTMALGLFAGLITLRLRGIYVGLTTLFLSEFVLFAFSNLRDYTRGAAGLQVQNFPDLFGISFARSNPMTLYYLLLVIVVIIYGILHLLVHSQVGLVFRAIRDDQLAASVLGFDIVRYKLLNFAVASFCIGIIGAFYGNYVGILVPTTQEFGISRTTEILTMTYVGGRGTLWGSLLGALTLIGIQEFSREIPQWRLVVYGLFLVFVLMLFPRGMAGAVTDIAAFLQRRIVSVFTHGKPDTLEGAPGSSS